MATYKNDWVNLNLNEYDDLTTHSSYGAVPPLVQAFDANSMPNVTIGASTISGGLSGGYTIGNGGTGASSNTVWTTNNTGAGSFTIGSNYSAEQSGKMSLRGENADLDINGKSLKNWMERVEERLNILTPNPELEKDWDDLRRLGERYRKLEKKCKEKAEVWKRLKQMPPPKL
jgi:hypothetical protein